MKWALFRPQGEMEQHRRIIDRGIERDYMCACVYRFICSCEGLKPSCEDIESGLQYLKGSQIDVLLQM